MHFLSFLDCKKIMFIILAIYVVYMLKIVLITDLYKALSILLTHYQLIASMHAQYSVEFNCVFTCHLRSS